MARPTKLTDEVQAKFCEALGLGVSIEAAAAHAGVSPATVHNWMKAGRDGKAPYVEFFAAATRARDRAEVRFAAVVAKAAQEGSASAAQWWLERRRPEHWARRDADVQVTTHVHGASDGAIALLRRLADAPPEAPEDDPGAR